MSQIENLYKTILGRDSDAGGKAYWEGELAKMTGGGMSEADALNKIAGDFRLSDEYKNLPTNPPPQTTLPINDTTPNPGSTTNSPVNDIVAGGTLPGSNEVSSYLDNLYKIAFDRDPDQEGKDYWLKAIEQGHHGDRNWQEWLTSSFHESPEYKGKWNKDKDGGTGPLPDVPQPDDPTKPKEGWWNEFEDADAFKKFLTGDKDDGGMGDFMKFMMLMSVMGGGRGFGGGGGGSQYGYGGLNPGGVMQAYDPIEQLTKMGTWFKDTWGSGSKNQDGGQVTPLPGIQFDPAVPPGPPIGKDTLPPDPYQYGVTPGPR